MDSFVDALAAGFQTLTAEGRLKPTPERPPDGATLLVLDLEMSGANPQQHEILEVGVVRVQLAPGFPEIDSWGTRVKPRHIGNANPSALRVVGYSPKAWRSAVELEPAAERLAKLGEGTIVTGWGIGQDASFLAELFRRVAIPWPFGSIALDIQPVARKLLAVGSDVDRFNLGHVADRLGIGRMGEHTALADAYAAYDVLVKLFERMQTAAGEA